MFIDRVYKVGNLFAVLESGTMRLIQSGEVEYDNIMAYAEENPDVVQKAFPPPEVPDQATIVRQYRDELLAKHIDCYNAVRWESMGAEERSAVIQYRKALCDVPQQKGFPLNVVWPNRPQ